MNNKPMQCEYRNTCKYNEQDSICCDLLFKICYFYRHKKRMEEINLEKVEFRVRGIENCFSDGELFELSQAEQDKGFQEDYY